MGFINELYVVISAFSGIEKNTALNSYSLRPEYLKKFDASSIDTFANMAE